MVVLCWIYQQNTTINKKAIEMCIDLHEHFNCQAFIQKISKGGGEKS